MTASKPGIVTLALVRDTFREAFARKIFWGFFGCSTAVILFFIFLMKIDVVGLRTVAFAIHFTRRKRVGEISKALIAVLQTALALQVNVPPFVRITGMEAEARKPVSVVNIRALRAKIIVRLGGRTRHAGDAITFMVLEAHAFHAAEVPRIHVGIVLPQVLV